LRDNKQIRRRKKSVKFSRNLWTMPRKNTLRTENNFLFFVKWFGICVLYFEMKNIQLFIPLHIWHHFLILFWKPSSWYQITRIATRRFCSIYIVLGEDVFVLLFGRIHFLAFLKTSFDHSFVKIVHFTEENNNYDNIV